MVILLDCVSKKLHPETFRCRQILPTSGVKSSSLWEAPSPEELTTWLNELLESDCTTEAFEVQEQFAIGLNELVAARVGEQLTASTRSAAGAASQKFDQLDEKFKVSEQAGAVLKVARDQGQVAAEKVSESWKKISSKAMENERVAVTAAVAGQAAQNTATVFRGLGEKISTSLGQTGLGKWMMPAAASPGSPGARAQTQQAADLQRFSNPDIATSTEAHAHTAMARPTNKTATPAAPRPAAPPSYEESTAAAPTVQAPAPAIKPATESAAQAQPQAAPQPPASLPPQAASSPAQDNIFSLGEDGDDEGPVLVPSAAQVPAVGTATNHSTKDAKPGP
eukprot:CAMPEP_0206136116 /NCGR_PEP_ID=MMETSP1473-20131121/1348_1 /ASSEMBLY_ACC=CAM_ASM_001109 /TAXON_ID=1461547 /ORGANISM="Stichococcus sp, Strain RCC1054" /LENGTH=336 /DNA_ID=CAMNT_0053528399 /DNA_START=181 /DNA_END=1191 /DNA_ORIENTATION=-